MLKYVYFSFPPDLVARILSIHCHFVFHCVIPRITWHVNSWNNKPSYSANFVKNFVAMTKKLNYPPSVLFRQTAAGIAGILDQSKNWPDVYVSLVCAVYLLQDTSQTLSTKNWHFSNWCHAFQSILLFTSLATLSRPCCPKAHTERRKWTELTWLIFWKTDQRASVMHYSRYRLTASTTTWLSSRTRRLILCQKLNRDSSGQLSSVTGTGTKKCSLCASRLTKRQFWITYTTGAISNTHAELVRPMYELTKWYVTLVVGHQTFTIFCNDCFGLFRYYSNSGKYLKNWAYLGWWRLVTRPPNE